MTPTQEKESEEIIEMAKDSSGSYKPIAIFRRPVNSIHRKRPTFYEFFDGFLYGLDAIERLFLVVNRYRKER